MMTLIGKDVVKKAGGGPRDRTRPPPIRSPGAHAALVSGGAEQITVQSRCARYVSSTPGSHRRRGWGGGAAREVHAYGTGLARFWNGGAVHQTSLAWTGPEEL